MQLLVGDVFLSAACISYMGAFTGERQKGTEWVGDRRAGEERCSCRLPALPTRRWCRWCP